MKKLLMVAFHYPPFVGGTGIHRTLKFSQYLPKHGWKPIVLTANIKAYSDAVEDGIIEIPERVLVARAFGFDTARHLSLRGFYLRCMALPDRWVTWWMGGVLLGLRLIRRYRPKVIWSTYPIASAHLIGLTLHRLTGLPWLADFRDPLTEANFPRDTLTRMVCSWVEKEVVKYSSYLIFTADSTRRMYVERYPELVDGRCLLIPNGYDEEDFKSVKFSADVQKGHDAPIRLLHAGVLYPDIRDPRPFFNALSRLTREGRVTAKNLRVDLRAAGSEDYYARIIETLGITHIVRVLPALPYHISLQDCADADGLLLFQGARCNHQIPAKVYEYLRIGKPILALTDQGGDTAALLRETNGATIVNLAEEQAIYDSLPLFLGSLRDGSHALPDHRKVVSFSREHHALELAAYLTKVADPRRMS
jgi:glycosyltransferase involved in cell wall biosynthesis